MPVPHQRVGHEKIVAWVEVSHQATTDITIMGPFVVTDDDHDSLRVKIEALFREYDLTPHLESVNEVMNNIFEFSDESTIQDPENDDWYLFTVRWELELDNEGVANAIKAAKDHPVSLWTVRQPSLKEVPEPIIIRDSEAEEKIIPFVVVGGIYLDLGNSVKTFLTKEDAVKYAKTLIPEDVPGQTRTLNRLSEDLFPPETEQGTSKALKVERDVLFAITKDVNDIVKGLVTVTKVVVLGHARMHPPAMWREV